MGAASFVQSNFLGGAWSKVSQGRIDSKEYRTALDTCLNSFPIEGGAWVRRPGFNFAATTRNGGAAKLVPFVFEQIAPYEVEFTDGFMRFFNGPSLVMTNDTQVVVSISSASPAKVKTTTAHGWSTGNQVQFGLLGTAAAVLQNRQLLITVTSSTEFTIVDPITGAAIDGSALGAIPVTATVSRVLEIVTPYGGSTWSNMRSVQAPKAAILLGSKAPYILTVTADPTPTTTATFSLDLAALKDGPYLDPVAGGATISPSGVTGSISLTIGFPAYVATTVYSKGDFVSYSTVNYQSLVDGNVGNQPDTHAGQWLAVSAGIAVGPNGFVGTDVGRMIRLFSEPPLWATGTTYAIGNVVAFNGTYWTALAAMTGTTPTTGNINPNQPGNLLTTWAVNAAAVTWTWGKITGFSNLYSNSTASLAFVGDMTDGAAALSAAFDGNTSKIRTASPTGTHFGFGSTVRNYIGYNFTSATGGDQKVASVTVFPPSDTGLVDSINGGSFVINLRGKATAPSSATDGTLIGTTGTITGNTVQPVSIVSTDQSTSWKYIWVELAVTTGGSGAFFFNVAVAQLQLYNPTGTGASATGVTFQILGPDLKYTTAIRVWRLGVYSDTTGWPTNGTYHEGRLLLSGVVKNRVDASVSNGIVGTSVNFSPTAASGAIADNNAWSYLFNSDDVEAIYWMKSQQQGVVCGTLAGEWLIQATTQGAILTPTNIQAHQVTHVGCANIEPARAELTTLFIQRYKHKLMEYFADVFSGKFSAPNLSVNSNHLVTRGMEEIAYQQTLTPNLWVRCTDGSLIGMAYKRESLMSSQGPEFFGWHEHTLGSGRVVESIKVAPSAAGYLTSAGLLDTIAVVTNDTATNIRYVEFLTNMFEENTPGTSAFFCDAAVLPSSYIEATVGGNLGITINGLWHLNGKTVSVFANGVDQGDFAVASGSTFVKYTALLTAVQVAAAAGALPLVVGFTYTSRGRIVRPALQVESGARNGPGFGKIRRVQDVAFLLQDTFGLSFGTVFGKLKPAIFQTPGGTAYSEGQLFSGIYWDKPSDDYSRDGGMVAWEISRPYPATVACLTAALHTQDM